MREVIGSWLLLNEYIYFLLCNCLLPRTYIGKVKTNVFWNRVWSVNFYLHSNIVLAHPQWRTNHFLAIWTLCWKADLIRTSIAILWHHWKRFLSHFWTRVTVLFVSNRCVLNGMVTQKIMQLTSNWSINHDQRVTLSLTSSHFRGSYKTFVSLHESCVFVDANQVASHYSFVFVCILKKTAGALSIAISNPIVYSSDKISWSLWIYYLLF